MEKTAALAAYYRFMKQAEEEEQEEEDGGERRQWMTPGRGAALGALTGAGEGLSLDLLRMLLTKGHHGMPLSGLGMGAGVGALTGHHFGKERVRQNQMRDEGEEE
jgi:hypothetical protein